MSDNIDYNDPKIVAKINELISLCGGNVGSFQSELIAQMIQNSLKMTREGYDLGQIKLMTKSMKEMRYAFRIFNEYNKTSIVSIFGSARTPEGHPDYLAAQEFSAKMSALHWTCMTGAANGIMKAGLAGAPPESSFGLSIRLPFEAPTNSFIENDPKLINFRYFFTRKLMFVSHSDAMAVFPGGFGTLDELFEVLTLMQTGKSHIIPLVLLQGIGSEYWQHWIEYVNHFLLANGWISPEDQNLYYRAMSVDDAVNHIMKFYKRYHSSRYVGDQFVMRLKSDLTDEQISLLNDRFSTVLAQGKIERTAPLHEEADYLDLPRIVFYHTRRAYSLLRLMIDQINDF